MRVIVPPGRKVHRLLHTPSACSEYVCALNHWACIAGLLRRWSTPAGPGRATRHTSPWLPHPAQKVACSLGRRYLPGGSPLLCSLAWASVPPPLLDVRGIQVPSAAGKAKAAAAALPGVTALRRTLDFKDASRSHSVEGRPRSATLPCPARRTCQTFPPCWRRSTCGSTWGRRHAKLSSSSPSFIPPGPALLRRNAALLPEAGRARG